METEKLKKETQLIAPNSLFKKACFLLVLNLVFNGCYAQKLKGTFATSDNKLIYTFLDKEINGFNSFEKVNYSDLYEFGTVTEGFYKIINDSLYEYHTYRYTLDEKKNNEHDENFSNIHLSVSEKLENIGVNSGIALRNNNNETLFYFQSEGKPNSFSINRASGTTKLVIGAAPQTLFHIPLKDFFWGRSIIINLSFYDNNLGKIYWDAKDQDLIVNNKYSITKTQPKISLVDAKGNSIILNRVK